MKRLHLSAALAGVMLSWSIPPALGRPADDGKPPSQTAPSFFQTLRNGGIEPRLVWSNDYAHNVSGGLSRGDANAGGVVVGADIDLDKAVGIPGAIVRVTAARYYGESVSQERIGNAVKVQGYWYPQQQTQLAQLSWEQNLDQGRWQLTLGRLNTTWQFARSRYGCRFVSASDCPFQLSQADGGFTGFPYVNWGGKLRFKPGSTYVSVGAFEIKPQRRFNNGLDWSTADHTGVLANLEVGYEPDPKLGKGAPRYVAGVWFNDADYSNLRYTRLGFKRALRPGPAQIYDNGRWGGYLLGEKALYRSAVPGGQRMLVLFGNLSAPFDSRQVYDLQATTGLYFMGPFASRPGDGAGLLATYYRFGRDEHGYMNDLLAKRGAVDGVSRDQVMLELNYSFKLGHTPLSVVPNLQYIANPDILGNTAATRAPGDALVVGLRVMFNYGGLGNPK